MKSEKPYMGMDFWREKSLKPQTEETLRDILLDYDPDSICVTYICSNSKLSEEFIEELIVLSTSAFDHKTYYPDYNKYFIPIALESSSEKRREMINDLYKKVVEEKSLDVPVEMVTAALEAVEKHNLPFSSRVDWFNIVNYQDISDSFKDKYKEQTEHIKSCAQFAVE